jgi:hypothetical protein
VNHRDRLVVPMTRRRRQANRGLLLLLGLIVTTTLGLPILSSVASHDWAPPTLSSPTTTSGPVGISRPSTIAATGAPNNFQVFISGWKTLANESPSRVRSCVPQ